MDKIEIPFPEIQLEVPQTKEAEEITTTPAHIAMGPIQTASELSERLEGFKEISKDVAEHVLSSWLLELPFPEEPFLDSIKQLSITEAGQLLERLVSATDQVAINYYKPFPDGILAYQMAYGLSYAVACHIDTQKGVHGPLSLATYGQDPAPLRLLLRNPDSVLADPKHEEKANQLLRYFEKGALRHTHPLFSFHGWEVRQKWIEGSFHSSGGGLELPPPNGSSEQKFLDALKRRVTLFEPQYQENRPKEVSFQTWVLASLFDKLTPATKHLLHYRRLYMQSRYMVISGEGERSAYSLNHARKEVPIWAYSYYEQQVEKLLPAKKAKEYKHTHRSLYPLDQKDLKVLHSINENKVFLKLPDELRSLFTIRSEPEVTLLRLLQHFEQHLADFESPPKQDVFFLTLFHMGDYTLKNEIARNPAFVPRLKNLIENLALPYFQARLISTEVTSDLEAAGGATVFLLALQGRIASYLNDAALFERSYSSLLVLSDRENPQNAPIFKERPGHRAACEALIQILLTKESWTEEETLQALVARASAAYSAESLVISVWAKNFWEDPRREHDVASCFFVHSDHLESTLSEPLFQQQALTAMVHATSVTDPCGMWSGTYPNFQAPLLDDRGAPKAKVKVNIVSGEVWRDGVLVMQSSQNSRKYLVCDVKQQYGEDVLNTIFTRYQESPARFKRIDREGKREIDLLSYLDQEGMPLLTVIKERDKRLTIEIPCRGRPFQMLSEAIFLQRRDQSKKLIEEHFPLRFGVDDVFYGISADGGPREILVTDRTLHPLGILTNEGKWIQDPLDPKSEATAIDVNEKQEVMGDESWQREEETEEGHILLKRYDPVKKNYIFVSFRKEMVSLSNSRKGERLVWEEDRRYFLSHDQTLIGMGQRGDYVILEDARGRRKVYFLGEKLYDLDRSNRPRSPIPEENGSFAHYAMKQGQYGAALHFLDQMTVSPKLGLEGLKILKEIVDAKDGNVHPNALALRLKAAFIASREVKAHPLLEDTRREKANEEWVVLYDFWTGDFLPKFLVGTIEDYFATEANVDKPLRLARSIGEIETSEWLIAIVQEAKSESPLILNALLRMCAPEKRVKRSVPLEPLTIEKKISPSLYGWRDLLPQKEGAITDFAAIFPKLRPGEKLGKAFDFLYKSATVGSVEDRKRVGQVIAAIQQEGDSTNIFIGAILNAMLHPDREPTLAAEIRRLVDEIREEKDNSYLTNPNDKRMEELQKVVKLWAVKMARPTKLPEGHLQLMGDLTKRLEAVAKNWEGVPLPKEPPPRPEKGLTFQTTFRIAPFDQVYALLEKVPTEERKIRTLSTPPLDSEYAKRRFEVLNEDYKMGQERNLRARYKVDKTTLAKLTETLEDSLEQVDLETLKTNLLELASQVPVGTLEEDIQQLEMIGGERSPITLDDCILAFLREDPDMLCDKNHHLSKENANRVRAQVGEYLCQSVEVWRLKQCLERSEEVVKNQNPALEEDLVELLRQTLTSEMAYDPKEFPSFLVFEYYGSEFLQSFVRLRSNQVEGITEMLQQDDSGSYRNIALQRIMGAGKTFVFGTVMALLKADGYHLSVHVPPSALFSSNSSEMLQKVMLFFQQKGHAIHFTRTPEHFTAPFLAHFYKTLRRAVNKREVILAAPETLLSLRNRYVEMRDYVADLYKRRAPLPEIAKVEGPLKILESIIVLLKERGVATLDEIDVTLAPNKEHNFPVGDRKSLNGEALELIEKIFYLATTDPELAPKLGLLRNHQSHLGEEERRALCGTLATKIIDHLIFDPKWKDRLLIYLLPHHERKDAANRLHDYLMSEEKSPPQELLELRSSDDPLRKELAEGIILIRKELRDWLPKGWRRNLDEHYGHSHINENYALARPYLANNTPNETAEFADRWEMINRTFHMYLVEGFSKGQIHQWVDLLRQEAIAEWKGEWGKRALHDVPTSLLFEEICGKKLFVLNVSDDKTIGEIQASLTNGSDKSIETVLEHTRRAVLGKVEVPLRQVSSNAQSLCSLVKTTQGYAGTMEDADTFPENIFVQRDVGTNGETIDVLQQKSNSFHVLESVSVSLASVVLSTL